VAAFREQETMMKPSLRRQSGIALPVMMIILLVMLVSSVYLFKASNSTTMTTANLAYDASLSKAADLGLHAGYQWLVTTAATNRNLLNSDDPANAYLANFNDKLLPSDPNYWVGKTVVTDAANNRIEYVVHRLCSEGGAYDNPTNHCVQTATNDRTLGRTVGVGDSLASDAQVYAGTPQLHYVITSRLSGPRGGNVVNQMVVLIGA
jgi:Tfp pilus assembly protein PilX